MGDYKGWEIGCRAREVDEEEEKSRYVCQLTICASPMVDLHNSETSPLHPDLHDAEQSSETSESIDLTAASHVCPAVWESEDVGELTCS